MKKLLATTAISMMAFTGAASAQTLLETILTNADDLVLSISNVAENIADIDASIEIDTTRDYAGIDTILATLMAGTSPLGSYSQVSTTVFASDFELPDLAFLAPLETTIGDLSTTAIGALQSGSMDISITSTNLVEDLSVLAASSSTNATQMGETYASISGGLAFQNYAFNGAANLDANIVLTLADVNATVGNVATTAIGALGSGDMVVALVGSLVP